MSSTRRSFLSSTVGGSLLTWGGLRILPADRTSSAVTSNPDATVQRPDQFIYGSAFFRPPNPPPEQRREMLRAIAQEHHFNIIRIYLAWVYCNPKPDQFDFAELEEVMRYCDEFGIRVLMGVITVEAAVKTTAVVSFVLPLVLLAVPFLDTTFVVLKRVKYRQPIYRGDSEHFHHRMARIGFSSRRTIAYLYVWTLLLAGFALALRFVPYSDHHGHLRIAEIAFGDILKERVQRRLAEFRVNSTIVAKNIGYELRCADPVP